LDNYDFPKDTTERAAFTQQVGQDGLELLEACYAPDAPPDVREVDAVEILRRVWLQQYYVEGSQIRWRTQQELPPHTVLICSPYEVEARYSTKRDTHWVGYKTHITETCAPDQPRIITHVATTLSTTDDAAVLPSIHADLAAADRLPEEHQGDAGYVDAVTLEDSARDYGVTVLGPVAPDSAWQARAPGGYTLADFGIDWDAEVVTCPQGVLSSCWSWTERGEPPRPLVHVRFPRDACHACAERVHCTRAKKDGRTLTFWSRPYHLALQARRHEQQMREFWGRLKPRAGIEGTLSQAVRAFGMRRTRYRGLAKTHLQHVLTAAAINLVRMINWAMGKPPRGTRTTRFAALVMAPPRLLPISC
jgi:transposase